MWTIFMTLWVDSMFIYFNYIKEQTLFIIFEWTIIPEPRIKLYTWKAVFFKMYNTVPKIGVSMIKQLIHLFSKNALTWSKVTVKTFIMVKKISISNKSCCLELYINKKKSEKTTVFKTLEMSLKHQIIILKLKDHVTLKIGVMAAENPTWSSQE